jgi:phosphate transport system ATP-binding protein
MTSDPLSFRWLHGTDDLEVEQGSFPDGAVVQLTSGRPDAPDATVTTLCPATVKLTDRGVVAVAGRTEWSWLLGDLEDVYHGGDQPWTIFSVPGVVDHGVAVRPNDMARFRRQLHDLIHPSTSVQTAPGARPAVEPEPEAATDRREPAPPVPRPAPPVPAAAPRTATAGFEARSISAWFGTHQVLDRVSLEMPAGQVTALIGPSGCGKSTFLRILNRMHEMTPSAALAGEVLLDGADIYDPARKVTDARRQIGMVFQKPNPFPAMSIYDNVVASFQLTGTKVGAGARDDVVESCLRKAGLWNEVRDRLRQPGGSLSGGQQQRLCIARALAIRPRVLLMDEPCSALDPTSTRRIEETIAELASEVTIVIVTHNMQQAARVSDRCAFFLAEQGTPGVVVEHGPTDAVFHAPQDPRTSDYVHGRFG